MVATVNNTNNADYCIKRTKHNREKERSGLSKEVRGKKPKTLRVGGLWRERGREPKREKKEGRK